MFEKLQDPALFTGSHRERFDQYGRGRGIAGRDSTSLRADPSGGDNKKGERWKRGLREDFYRHKEPPIGGPNISLSTGSRSNSAAAGPRSTSRTASPSASARGGPQRSLHHQRPPTPPRFEAWVLNDRGELVLDEQRTYTMNYGPGGYATTLQEANYQYVHPGGSAASATASTSGRYDSTSVNVPSTSNGYQPPTAGILGGHPPSLYPHHSGPPRDTRDFRAPQHAGGPTRSLSYESSGSDESSSSELGWARSKSQQSAKKKKRPRNGDSRRRSPRRERPENLVDTAAGPSTDEEVGQPAGSEQLRRLEPWEKMALNRKPGAPLHDASRGNDEDFGTHPPSHYRGSASGRQNLQQSHIEAPVFAPQPTPHYSSSETERFDEASERGVVRQWVDDSVQGNTARKWIEADPWRRTVESQRTARPQRPDSGAFFPPQQQQHPRNDPVQNQVPSPQPQPQRVYGGLDSERYPYKSQPPLPEDSYKRQLREQAYYEQERRDRPLQRHPGESPALEEPSLDEIINLVDRYEKYNRGSYSEHSPIGGKPKRRIDDEPLPPYLPL